LTPEYHLVIDLEATCDDQRRMPREESEIIEIGAVLVDAATFAAVDEWQTFVRPIVHVELTPFCRQLTSIRQEQVEAAPLFPEAIAGLRVFLRGREVQFCSWGNYDRNQLRRDASRHGVALPLGDRHLDLKRSFRVHSGGAQKLGVGQALARVGLRFEGTAHRGIDDARNIARLLPYALGRRPIPPV
jgi:inhibitor of KinA sporulation pathway (predicted exonuclease)